MYAAALHLPLDLIRSSVCSQPIRFQTDFEQGLRIAFRRFGLVGTKMRCCCCLSLSTGITGNIWEKTGTSEKLRRYKGFGETSRAEQENRFDKVRRQNAVRTAAQRQNG